jgi:hypothetical protein
MGLDQCHKTLGIELNVLSVKNAGDSLGSLRHPKVCALEVLF